MVITERYHKLILKYFIGTVGVLQSKILELDFGFHTFGPFRKLTRHCVAAPGATVFVFMAYIQFVFMWYSFYVFRPFRKLTRHYASTPKRSRCQHSQNNSSQIRGPFANTPSQIKPWWRLLQSLTRHGRCQ